MHDQIPHFALDSSTASSLTPCLSTLFVRRPAHDYDDNTTSTNNNSDNNNTQITTTTTTNDNDDNNDNNNDTTTTTTTITTTTTTTTNNNDNNIDNHRAARSALGFGSRQGRQNFFSPIGLAHAPQLQ